MTIANDAETAIAAVIPETRLIKPILYGGVALLAIAALALAWWLLFGRAHAAEVKAATAQVQAATATGTAGAAESTLHIVTDNARTVAAIDALTQENARAIQSAPGSAVVVDPALDAAGRHALCMRSAYSTDAGCAALRGDGGGLGPAQADTGRGAAGK